MPGRRVLLVGNDARTFLSHRLALARALRARGHEVHVALPPSERDAVLEAEGFVMHALPLNRRGIHPIREARTLRATMALYRLVRPDLAHQITIKPIVYGGHAARATGVPAVVHAVTGLGYVFTSNDARARLLRPAIRAAYRRAFRHPNARIVFQNRDDLDVFVDHRIADRSRCVLIPSSGVDPTRFVPMPEPEGVPVIVLPARMLRDKGVLEFVEAARTLQARGIAARMVLVGDADPGNPASIARSTLAAWAKEGAVEWWGWRDDMRDVLAQANIVCLPSYREGVPRALLEAAACARALVTTDAPGCRDAILPARSGILVPPRDPGALADAIARLVEDAPLRARMGAAGRALVLERFTEARVVASTIGVYEELLR